MIEKSPDVSTLTDDGKRFANRGHHGDPQLHSRAKNIFWQVAGQVEVGAFASMKGIILVKTDALFMTGSSLLGRVLAQTACNIQMATIDGRIV
jgi:hypothetical protein